MSENKVSFLVHTTCPCQMVRELCSTTCPLQAPGWQSNNYLDVDSYNSIGREFSGGSHLSWKWRTIPPTTHWPEWVTWPHPTTRVLVSLILTCASKAERNSANITKNSFSWKQWTNVIMNLNLTPRAGVGYRRWGRIQSDLCPLRDGNLLGETEHPEK